MTERIEVRYPETTMRVEVRSGPLGPQGLPGPAGPPGPPGPAGEGSLPSNIVTSFEHPLSVPSDEFMILHQMGADPVSVFFTENTGTRYGLVTGEVVLSGTAYRVYLGKPMVGKVTLIF